MHSRKLHFFLAVSSASLVLADTNDWININYVLQQGGGNGDTVNSRQKIASNAGNTVKNGPWTVVNQKVMPPSKDIHDYLSWAPYHWPDCHYCSTSSKGRTHLTNPNDLGDNSTEPQLDPDDPYEDGGDDSYQMNVDSAVSAVHSDVILPRSSDTYAVHRRMHRVRRRVSSIHAFEQAYPSNEPSEQIDKVDQPSLPIIGVNPIATGSLITAAPQPTSSSQSPKAVYGTPTPAQAGAKTQKGKAAASCTPSPTKSLAPSATWTTCEYVVRDGKVNPDVRTLPGPPSVVGMSQSVLYNSISYTLQKTSTYSRNAASAIDYFFLAPATAMNPNMNFGQMVRGPGAEHQVGTFTGILDLRSLVKVVNAVQLLRAMQSPDWTSARDANMNSWMKKYLSWLQTSSIGKETASKANNHLTFYVNQLAAAKICVSDSNGAADAVRKYFSNAYLDQVAASGEQPFEAVRTRPYHYRAFNLEAMITNAKLGDQLGLNLWIAKSRYGATIQTALDYAMGIDPKGEDVSDILPHVAAVAAAYGDPKGKYAAFLTKHNSAYKTEPFWFYDQTSALPNSPAARSKPKRDESDSPQSPIPLSGIISDTSTASASQAAVAFQCPAVFAFAESVELEDGLFVTCDQLKPFYEIALPVDTDIS